MDLKRMSNVVTYFLHHVNTSHFQVNQENDSRIPAASSLLQVWTPT